MICRVCFVLQWRLYNPSEDMTVHGCNEEVFTQGLIEGMKVSDWGLKKTKDFSKFVSIKIEGLEEQTTKLFEAIEAQTKVK